MCIKQTNVVFELGPFNLCFYKNPHIYYEQKLFACVWNIFMHFLHQQKLLSFPKQCLLAKCTCFQHRKCFHWPLQWLLFSVRAVAAECEGFLCLPSLAAGAPLTTVMWQ